MKSLLLVVALVCGVLALQAQSPSPLPRPADGTYTYVLERAGKKLGTTCIIVQSKMGLVSVTEEAEIGKITVTTETSLDPATLREVGYRGSSPQEGSFSATIDATGLVLHAPIGDFPLKQVEGTERTFVSDGLISSLALFPSLAHAAAGKPLTDAGINGLKASRVDAAPSTQAVPAGLPAGTVGLVETEGTSAVTFWYDPATYVVRLVSAPANATEIRLTGASTDVVAIPTPKPMGPRATPVPLGPAHYASRDMTFRSADGTMLAGTLTIPNTGHAPYPAFVLVHGSGPLDRDETIGPNKVFAQIAHALSNRGYVVLRYDKRGVGASGGAPVGQNGRSLLLDDARAAIALLRAQPEVNRTRVYVLGHSEGTLLAPSLAIADPTIRGLVLMGMPALPLDRVLVEQLTRNQSGAALTRARADAEKMMAAIKNGTSRDPSAIWYRSEFPIDPPQLIARVPVPMLLLQGGKDVQVYAKHLPLLVAAARATHRDLTVREFPNDGHLMMQMPTSDKPLDEYTTAAHFDPNVLAAIFAWLARN